MDPKHFNKNIYDEWPDGTTNVSHKIYNEKL